MTTDPIDPSGDDLIHARLVLEHLPQRNTLISRLVGALRPGGWLVVENYDPRTISVTDPPSDAWSATGAAVVDALRAVGVDPHFGTALPASRTKLGSTGRSRMS